MFENLIDWVSRCWWHTPVTKDKLWCRLLSQSSYCFGGAELCLSTTECPTAVQSNSYPCTLQALLSRMMLAYSRYQTNQLATCITSEMCLLLSRLCNGVAYFESQCTKTEAYQTFCGWSTPCIQYHVTCWHPNPCSQFIVTPNFQFGGRLLAIDC